MTQQPMIAISKNTHLSQRTPYDQAVHLHSLIKAAMHLVDSLPSAGASDVGLPGLLTVIEERADDLENLLDRRAFCEDWKEA